MTEKSFCLAIFIIGLILGTILYRSIKRIKQLEAERLELTGKICQLKSELATYVYTSNKVVLTLPEKRIMLSALEDSGYKSTITNPKTKKFIRMIYNTLRGKIKDSIKRERMGNYG